MVNPTRSAARMAEEGIADYIREHRLGPGDVLPSESELCEAIQCSRSSLREAVRTLSSLDVVEVRHGHGTFVSGMSLEPLFRGLLLRISLNPDHSLAHLRHVIDAREAMDLIVAEEIAAHFEGRDLSEQWEIIGRVREHFAAGQPAIPEYIAFHLGLYAPLSNPLIKEMAATFLRIHIECFELLDLEPPRDAAATIAAHTDLLTALAAGDADGVRAAVKAHYVTLRRFPE
ncbi:MAG: GntR family transcriptional regulator [Corynebacterium sp.]|uniref:FadR/GntR family transcriptional regulator n=1 Tax=Corynebacterium sp. TaxID=1720 RepID=UPI0026E022C8|nr:GntR family transcriptional regulator [Corynebacterium sp.]MDO5671049.1 GntR family transcriptional regulator [Corynebacterium sp.]